LVSGGLAKCEAVLVRFLPILFRVLLKKVRATRFFYFFARVVWFSDWDRTSLVVSALVIMPGIFGFGGLAT
jgi:hypothetical protein